MAHAQRYAAAVAALTGVPIVAVAPPERAHAAARAAAATCALSVPARSHPPGGGDAPLPGNGQRWTTVPSDGRLVASPLSVRAGAPGLQPDGSILRSGRARLRYVIAVRLGAG